MSYLDWDTTANRPQRRRRYNLLDGVDSQAASSKPTVRSDGTTLQTGDRWLDTSDRLWWFWNGTYWLSEQLFEAHSPFGNGTAVTGGWGHHRINQSYNLYLLSFSYGGQLQTPQDTSNYWDIKLERGNASAAHAVITTINTSTPTISSLTGVNLSQSLNLHLDVTALSALYLRAAVYKTASPGNLVQGIATTRYRLAKP